MTDRVVYIDQLGDVQCVDGRAIAAVPTAFDGTLSALCNDLQLALDCIRVFGGMPVPVAKAILRNIEPAHTAIDLAVRTANRAEKDAN